MGPREDGAKGGDRAWVTTAVGTREVAPFTNGKQEKQNNRAPKWKGRMGKSAEKETGRMGNKNTTYSCRRREGAQAAAELRQA